MRPARASKAVRVAAAASAAAVLPRGKVPTLTEVVEIGDTRPTGVRPPALELVGSAERGDLPASSAASSAAAQAELTGRVLHAVQQQVDTVLEARLKDLLVPILAQCAESMMAALRSDLASTLHGVVSEAVVGELARQERKT